MVRIEYWMWNDGPGHTVQHTYMSNTVPRVGDHVSFPEETQHIVTDDYIVTHVCHVVGTADSFYVVVLDEVCPPRLRFRLAWNGIGGKPETLIMQADDVPRVGTLLVFIDQDDQKNEYEAFAVRVTQVVYPCRRDDAGWYTDLLHVEGVRVAVPT